MKDPDKWILIQIPVTKKVRLIAEFPVVLQFADNGLQIVVCSTCGYPIADVQGHHSAWYCPKCAKFRKGGSTNDVRWIVTKEAEE